MAIDRKYRANELIRGVREVRLIDHEGKMVGIVPFYKALEMSRDSNLDLVEVGAGNPPVCKILDFGKFKYEQAKAAKEARKNQQVTEIKEVVLHPSTEEHDLLVRAKQITAWLQEGNKVSITVKMRGRERIHPEKAVEIITVLLGHSGPHAVDSPIKKEDRRVFVFVSPAKNKHQA